MLGNTFRSSLSFKFFRIIALALLVGTILLSVIISFNGYQSSIKRLAENGHTLAVFIAKLSKERLIAQDSVALDAIVHDALGDETAYILIYDAQDKLLTSRFASLNYRVPILNTVLAGLPIDTDLSGIISALNNKLHITEVTLPIEIDDVQLGKVVLGMSEHVTRHEITSTVIFVLSINLFIASLLCFVLIMVSRRILLDPLTALAKSNLKLAGGDLSERVNLKVKGELKLLVDSFNHMAASLDENERQLKVIFDTSRAGIIMVNEHGVIVLANRSMSDIFGCNHDELISRTYLSLVSPDHYDSAAFTLQKLLSGELQQISRERLFKRCDGDFWGYASARRHNDAEGKLISIVFIISDMTGQKRVEAERLNLERRFLHSQKLESLGVLAGGIAHDFNNLLAVILGNLDLTLMRLPPSSPAIIGIERAMQAGRRAADLTRQMLAYSGKGIVQLVQVDLNLLVRENVDFFNATIPKTITLNIDLADFLPMVTVDPSQIQQVVMNLITNAMEAIGEKPGVLTLSTGVQDCSADFLSQSRLEEKQSAGRYAYIEVSDSGSGMDAESRQRLFEPFYSTKFTGRGLGMSAVLGIIRAHHGAIMVASELGLGSVFRVLLPANDYADAENRTPEQPAKPAEIMPDFSGTVLVVDDEPYVRDFCVQCITIFGFTPLVASDGLEALEIFRKHGDQIRLVILDMTMPKIDGVSTFKELRRISPEVKVIICSGHSAQSTTMSFTDDKPAAFIQKPYNALELQEKIGLVLRTGK